ncbi:MAG: hypothetical protein LBT04_09255 [Prevotellaceae bacterium]|jgi:hypothetical protein|nr:hypothetical protein [Prevotellaceae bacterium]
MKKIFFTVLVMSGVTLFAAAQDNEVTNSKGKTTLLPQEGSIALGIDATPFFKYLGGIFSDTDADTPEFTYGAFYGKYFLTDKMAIRGKLRLGYLSDKSVNLVPEDNKPDEKVKDITKISGTNIELKVGLERRIGKTRFQGFYGAEVGFEIGNQGNRKYTWGNELIAGQRTLSDRNGTTYGIGADLFAGIEYFVASYVAISGELGWGIKFASTGKGVLEYEYMDGSKINTKKIETGGSSKFSFDNFGGAINVIFYF